LGVKEIVAKAKIIFFNKIKTIDKNMSIKKDKN
jgi:hypothetical protein